MLRDIQVQYEKIPYRQGILDLSIWSESPLKEEFCYLYLSAEDVGTTLHRGSTFSILFIHGGYMEDTNPNTTLFGGFGTYFEGMNKEQEKMALVCESPFKSREVSLKELNRAFQGVLSLKASTPFKEFRGRGKENFFGLYGKLAANAHFILHSDLNFRPNQRQIFFRLGQVVERVPRDQTYCSLDRLLDSPIHTAYSLKAETKLEVSVVNGGYYRQDKNDHSRFQTTFHFSPKDFPFSLTCSGKYREKELSTSEMIQELGNHLSAHLTF